MGARMLDRIEFLLSEAFVSLRRNTWMTFSAISTAAVALFLIGGFGYVYWRIQTYALSLPTKFEMHVFLKESATRADVSEVAAKIRAMPEVEKAVWVPKEEAWKQRKRDMPEVTQGLDNPLPDEFRIRLKSLETAPAVAAKIALLPAVDPNGVTYLGDEQKMLSQALALLRWIGIGVGGLLLVTSGVLIYNSIRLTIVARWREMRIMQLIGASWSTIATPLLIEGMVQGAIGGLIAAALMLGAHTGAQRMVQSISATMDLGTFPMAVAAVVLVSVGMVYGAICSALALRGRKGVYV
jgi:cell division transport system permease protein